MFVVRCRRSVEQKFDLHDKERRGKHRHVFVELNCVCYGHKLFCQRPEVNKTPQGGLKRMEKESEIVYVVLIIFTNYFSADFRRQ